MDSAPEPIAISTERSALAALVAGFAIAHAGCYLLGVRFDASPLETFWQYLDTEWLRHDLLLSVFYLHAQPPLFNLFLGMVLGLTPGPEAAVLVFQATYLVLGLVLLLALFLTMRRLGVTRRIAAVLGLLFVLSPSFVCYEHWLFYTFPEATLLTCSVYCLHRWLDTRRTRYAAALFLALFLLAGIRSIFHLAWVVLIAVALAVLSHGDRKRVLAVAAIPCCLLAGIYLKNGWLFGTYSASSWLGMSVAKVTLDNVPEPRLEQMIAAGQLSEIAAIEPFSDLEHYPARFRDVRPIAPIPALAAPCKSNGLPNFNHMAYLGVSRQYLADAVATVQHEPRALAIGLAKGGFRYFEASSAYDFIAANRDRLALPNALYERVLYGRIPWPIPYRGREHFVYLFLLAGLPAVWLHGVFRVRGGPPGARSPDRTERLTLAFICFNVLYVAVLVNALESGENNRFRFVTDPLSLMLLGVLVQRVLAERLVSRVGSPES